MSDRAHVTHTAPARVLVFHVDDAKFCLHLDWVEAIYPRKEVSLHTLKAAGGGVQLFLIHRGQPAWVVDLRQAFGLEGVLEPASRPSFAVIRCGSALVALQVDECVGVRDLDLAERLPVPAALLRDGGNPVGHLVELDNQIHILLEPNRILNAQLRDALDPLLPEALAFRDRQIRLDRLLPEVKQRPNAANLRVFARLAKRNGHARLANAVQRLLKIMDSGPHYNGGLQGDVAAGTLVRDLLTLAGAEESGQVEITGTAKPAALIFDQGRLVDATFGSERGKPAVKEIVALREGSYTFHKDRPSTSMSRIHEATAWVLIEAIEQLIEERRGRHLRVAQATATTTTGGVQL